MRNDPFDSDPPPDEAWWERELHRNEKLMDKYLAVMEANPDWVNWDRPEDLYNKVHYGIDPTPTKEQAPRQDQGGPVDTDSSEDDPETSPTDEVSIGTPETAEDEDNLMPEDAAMIDAMQAGGHFLEGEDPEAKDDLFYNDNYRNIARQARDFALRVIRLGPGLREDFNVLLLSAGKIGANLAGGHGLGYTTRSICGNIVKCRWALADCEFCREMIEAVSRRSADSEFAALSHEAAALADAIEQRIAHLRERVWW